MIMIYVVHLEYYGFYFLYQYFIFFTFRSLRKWLKAQPKEVRRKYYKLLALKLAVLFGGFGAFSSYNYYKHEQEAPITHRKRYISLTPEQYLKIAEVESQEVSTWLDRLKLMTSLVVVVVALLFYVHGKYLRSCRGGQLT